MKEKNQNKTLPATLRNSHKLGGFKDTNIFYKIISLRVPV